MAFVVDGYETNQCWRVRDWTEEKKKFWTRQYILLMFGVLLYKTTNNVSVCVCVQQMMTWLMFSRVLHITSELLQQWIMGLQWPIYEIQWKWAPSNPTLNQIYSSVVKWYLLIFFLNFHYYFTLFCGWFCCKYIYLNIYLKTCSKVKCKLKLWVNSTESGFKQNSQLFLWNKYKNICSVSASMAKLSLSLSLVSRSLTQGSGSTC